MQRWPSLVVSSPEPGTERFLGLLAGWGDGGGWRGLSGFPWPGCRLASVRMGKQRRRTKRKLHGSRLMVSGKGHLETEKREDEKTWKSIYYSEVFVFNLKVYFFSHLDPSFRLCTLINQQQEAVYSKQDLMKPLNTTCRDQTRAKRRAILDLHISCLTATSILSQIRFAGDLNGFGATNCILCILFCFLKGPDTGKKDIAEKL